MLPRTPNLARIRSGERELKVECKHPQDAHQKIAPVIEEVELRLPSDDRLTDLRPVEEAEERLRNPARVKAAFATFKSVEEPENPVCEVKLSGDENDLLLTTQKILQQLKTDEQHLITIMNDYQMAQNREPVKNWWEDRSDGFGAEAHQSQLQAKLQGLADELGVGVDELKRIATEDEGGVVRTGAEVPVSKVDAGC